MAFSKHSARLSSYLKTKNIDKEILLGSMTTVLYFLTKLAENPEFSESVDSGYIDSFVKASKDIRQIKSDKNVDQSKVEKLSDSLIPLASAIKRTALATQTNQIKPKRKAKPSFMVKGAGRLGDIQKASSLGNLSFLKQNSRDVLSSTESLAGEDKKPLGYQHDLKELKLPTEEIPLDLGKKYESDNLDMISKNEDKSVKQAQESVDPGAQKIGQAFSQAQNNVESNEESFVKIKMINAMNIGSSILGKYRENVILFKVLTPHGSKVLKRTFSQIRTLYHSMKEDYEDFFHSPEIFKFSSPSQILKDSEKLCAVINRSDVLKKSSHLQNFIVVNSSSENVADPAFKSAENLHEVKLEDLQVSPKYPPQIQKSSPVGKKENGRLRSSSLRSVKKLAKSSLSYDSLVENSRSRSGSMKKSPKLIDEYEWQVTQKFQNFIEEQLKSGFVRLDEFRIAKLEDGESILQIELFDGVPRAIQGTKDSLLELCLNMNPETDPKYPECFILTHRFFISSDELLANLILNYKEVPNDENLQAINQMRIAACVQKWVEIAWSDFQKDSNLLNNLLRFNETIKSSNRVNLMADIIEKTIANKQKKEHEDTNLSFNVKSKIDGVISNVGSTEMTIYDPLDVAQQFTKIDSQLYESIGPLDLLNGSIGKNSPDSPYDLWAKRFNLVSYWVATEICTAPLLKRRIEKLEFFLKLAKHLKDLNNLNGAMALIAGLNLSSVKRLKKTWAGVSGKLISQFHFVEKIMDPSQNYQVYRELETKSFGRPFIPFLGLYSRDLTFANDGNSIKSEKNQINFSKCWSIFEIVERAVSFKKSKYELPENAEVYKSCSGLVALTDKRLYNYSILCEPKENDEKLESPRLIEKWAQ